MGKPILKENPTLNDICLEISSGISCLHSIENPDSNTDDNDFLDERFSMIRHGIDHLQNAIMMIGNFKRNCKQIMLFDETLQGLINAVNPDNLDKAFNKKAFEFIQNLNKYDDQLFIFKETFKY